MLTETLDPETDALVKEFASSKGLQVGEAIRLAVENARKWEAVVQERIRRTNEIVDEIATWPRTGLKADKAFFDQLSGDDDD